ncbi:hypothetical protein SODALDRAFT_318995 [Sodiomyces alkalinus F11]|uniref:Uncharacterized protein n=1 Tax=Sodiomyces alkalinus (strain CBS 110278 / VKM F-3762 / F11) TaxID=1314773 RepID=A0A3N2Q6D8_SODAK|nr:hypothetical protein SODALDRAFT_318995 [Sodiomyces alkalinus F11]ROT42276.1 hypothetical protein SODALDRAFT_318995 [Sodiomyces alkalinus F11]
MPRGREYTSVQIRFILAAVLRKESVNSIISSYHERFQKTLRPQQIRYVRIKYGNDPVLNTCLVNQVVKTRKYPTVSRGHSFVKTRDGGTKEQLKPSARTASTQLGATPPSPRQVSTVPSVPDPAVSPILPLVQNYQSKVHIPLDQASMFTFPCPQLFQPPPALQTSEIRWATQQQFSKGDYPCSDSSQPLGHTIAFCHRQQSKPSSGVAATVDNTFSGLFSLGLSEKSTSQNNSSPSCTLQSWGDNDTNSGHGATYNDYGTSSQRMAQESNIPGYSASTQRQPWDLPGTPSAYNTALLPRKDNATPQYYDNITNNQQDIPLDPELLPGGQYFTDQEDTPAGPWNQTKSDIDFASIDWSALLNAQPQATTAPTQDRSAEVALATFEEMETTYQPSKLPRNNIFK